MERKINGVLTEFEGEVDRFLLSLGTNRVRGNVNKLLLLNAQLQEAQVCVVELLKRALVALKLFY